MATTFRPYNDIDQPHLFPPSPREWLPPQHLAYFVSDAVDTFDMTPFYAPYLGDGRRNSPYDPRMMLKVLIYAYATGVFSSRKIDRSIGENIAFRVLAGGNHPNHRTICAFRKRHLDDFRALFVHVVRVACEMGMVRFGTLSIDGMKLRANASKRKAMSYGRMIPEKEKLRREISALLLQADHQDAAEDTKYGEALRGDELPAALSSPEERSRGMQAALDRMAEKDLATEEDLAAAEEGVAEEEEDLAAEVARRQARLATVEAAEADLRARQQADDDRKGYTPEEKISGRAYGEPKSKAQRNFTDPESRIMKTSQEGFQQCYNVQTVVDDTAQLIVETRVENQANDQGLLVPMVDAVAQTHEEVPAVVLADTGYCNESDLKVLEDRGIDAYVATGRRGRDKTVSAVTRPATARMQTKLDTPRGRAQYARRKWLSEAPHGWIKEVLHFRRFGLRGLAQVRGEWDLVCLSLNLRRMFGLQMAL